MAMRMFVFPQSRPIIHGSLVHALVAAIVHYWVCNHAQRIVVSRSRIACTWCAAFSRSMAQQSASRPHEPCRALTICCRDALSLGRICTFVYIPLSGTSAWPLALVLVLHLSALAAPCQKKGNAYFYRFLFVQCSSHSGSPVLPLSLIAVLE